jgi:CRISPR/Cas system type I-B associated protein Csh2 (Cas7 group RAMP superfamily)
MRVALHAQAGGDIKKTPREELLRKYFYDVRTFGAVITKSGKGAGEDDSGGQLIGPVQVGFGLSLKPVDIIKITCTGPSREDPKLQGGKKLEELVDPEEVVAQEAILRQSNTGEIRTMGRGYVVNDAIYRFQISVSPFQAANTGFNGTDLALLLVALKRWPDWYKTSSKTGMEHVRAFIFKHSSKYGNMPIWEIQEKLDETLKEMGTSIDHGNLKPWRRSSKRSSARVSRSSPFRSTKRPRTSIDHAPSVGFADTNNKTITN